VLTGAQVMALEKSMADKEAHGEFESECSGSCGAQDTFYVSAIKGAAESISRASLIPIAKWALPNCTTATPRRPQTNGICERFPKTMLPEFYRGAFRKKLSPTLDEIQRAWTTA
jgi:hypothetical protein